MAKPATILIVAEQHEGKLRQVSLEGLRAARLLGGKDGRRVLAIIGNGVSVASRKLAAHDVERVLTADHPELAGYHPELYLTVMLGLIEDVQPDVIIMGHTAMGKDLAPRLAARLCAGLVSDVTSITVRDDEVCFTRPVYAGKAFAHVAFADGVKPWMITIRANNIAPDTPVEADAPITPVPYRQSVTLHTVVSGIVRKTAAKVDLAEARIVVSGGRGVKSREGFGVLQELADVLGAAIGASRGACDAGYCDYALQIGQTGKVVTPDLYIACGISGAIQHLAGMSQSRVIVAINTDPEAPIFQIANYGIVGDMFEVVPLLTEALRQRSR